MILKEHDKKRIMIIEDDAEMRSLLIEFLGEDGYQVDSAQTGLEALSKITKEVFDLIVTDIRMPGLTGLDILSSIKKQQPQVPIIVITAFGNEEVYRRSMERGASAYLEKPICFNKLGVLIHEMVSSKNE